MKQDKPVLFTGNVEHKLDPKSRVSVPAAWRAAQSGTLKLIAAQRDGHPIIKCYTEETFSRMVENVRTEAQAAGRSMHEIDSYLGVIIGLCNDAELSSQGKLLIPKNQREVMQLTESVTIVGRGEYFELWEPQSYQAVYTPQSIQNLELNKMFGILS